MPTDPWVNPDAPTPNPNPTTPTGPAPTRAPTPTGPRNTDPGNTTGQQGNYVAPYEPTASDFALIRRALDAAGLGSLYDWAVSLMINGGFEDENQLYFALRDTPEFQERFQGLLAREQAGLPPISVQEALAYENQAYQLMRSADFPPGFYDTYHDFQAMIANNISFNELNQRVSIYVEAAGVGREQIREELIRHMGNAGIGDAVDAMSDGDLAAWLLDPDAGLQAVRQRVSSAEVSATARQAGFGALSYEEATQMVGEGIEAQQSRQAFSDLARAGDVTGTLAGEQVDSGMARGNQLGLVRGVGESIAEFEARRRRRQGAFEGGGTFSTGQEGVTGVGVA